MIRDLDDLSQEEATDHSYAIDAIDSGRASDDVLRAEAAYWGRYLTGRVAALELARREALDA